MKFFAFFGIWGIIWLSSCSDFEVDKISCKINLEKNTDNCPNGYYCKDSKCEDKKTLCGDKNCSENGYCDVVRDVSSEKPTYKTQCFCDSGYYQVTANVSLTNTSSEIICEKGKNPCSFDTLENNSKCLNGTCISDYGEIYHCECNANYVQSATNNKVCVNLCENIDCNGNGTCSTVNINGVIQAECKCDSDYKQSEDKKSCINLCENINCGGNGVCNVNTINGNTQAECECNSGYKQSEDKKNCVSLCENINCNGNGSCNIDTTVSPQKAYCDCNDLFQDNDKNLTCLDSCDKVLLLNANPDNITKVVCDDTSGFVDYECTYGYQDNDDNYSCLESCNGNRPHLVCDDSSGVIIWDFISYVFSTVNIDEAISVKLDKEGNIFSLGMFDGVIDFNPLYAENEVDIFVGTSTKGYGFYLNKLKSDNNYAWTIAMLPTDDGRDETTVEDEDIYIKDFVLDSEGNIYIYGSFRGGLKFYKKDDINGYLEIPNSFISTALDNYNIFIVKFDKNRNFVEKYILGESGKDEFAHSIALGEQNITPADNALYISGSFEGNLTVTNEGAANSDDYCGILTTIDFNPSADNVDVQTIKGAGSGSYETNIGICNTGENNEYHNFGNCLNSDNRCAGPSKKNVFVTKLTLNLENVWSKVILQEKMNLCYKAYDSKLGTKNGLVIVNSLFKYDQNEIINYIGPNGENAQYNCEDTTSSNIYNSYISAFQTTGIHHFTWEFYHQNPSDIIGEIQSYESYLYAVSTFKGKIDFSFVYPSTDYKTSTCKNGNTVCSDGNYSYDLAITKVSFAQYVGTKVISSTNDIIYKNFIMDKYGNIYIVGTFEGTVTFQTFDAENITRISEGAKDIFVLKLDKNLSFKWVQTIGGYNDDTPTKCVLDEEGKNIYISGHFKSPTIQFYSDYFYDEFMNADYLDDLIDIDSDIFLWKLLNY